VTISRDADTVQIIITGELVEAVTGEPAPATTPQLGSGDLLLQAAAAQALVAVAHDRKETGADLDRIVRSAAADRCHFLSSSAPCRSRSGCS
jgi:hypothetical protein